MTKLPEEIIDFHVHLFPEKGFEAIWRAFDTLYGCSVLHKLYHNQCIDYLRKRGVGPIVYSNYAHKKGFARPMNEWNKTLLNKTEDLFCFAAFHPDDEDSLAYAEDILSHPRVMGIKLHFLIQEFLPYDKKFFPLYEMIMDKGKRLLMHIGNGPIGNKYTGYANFKKLIDIYPELPVNIPHMGALEYLKFMELLDDYPNLIFDTAYCFWPQIQNGFRLENKYLEKNMKKIVYGSDFPNVILPREDEIKGLLQLELSQEFYDNIFCKNGIKIIKNSCPDILYR